MKEATAELEKTNKALLTKTRMLEGLALPLLGGYATAQQKQQAQELLARIRALTEQSVAIQRQYDAWAERVRFVETITLTPDTARQQQAHTFGFPSSDPALAASQSSRLRTLFDVEGEQLPTALTDLLQRTATLSASLEVLSSGDSSACEQAGLDSHCRTPSHPDWRKGKPKAIPGIAFRNPARARLRVCQNAPAEACRHAADGKILLDTTVSVPQLGRLVILPFRNGFGANNQIEAVFREDGSLDWLRYDARETSGQHAANLLGDSAGQLLAHRERRRDQQQEEREQARQARETALDTRIAVLRKQEEVAELSAQQAPDAVAHRQTLTRLQAEIARLNAHKQLQELKAALGDGSGP